MLMRRILLFLLISSSAVWADDFFLGVDYFYRPGCPECRRVREEVLPEVEARYAGLVKVRHFNMEYPLYGAALGSLLRRIDGQDSAVHLVIGGERVVSGWEAIRDNTHAVIDAALADGLSGAMLFDADDETLTGLAVDGAALVWLVIAAGLADAVNPCAISTLIFLVSVLVSLKLSWGRVLLVGAAFCAGIYVTYFAIGVGLLHGLRLILDRWEIAFWFDRLLLLAVLALAGVSLYDAVRYLQTGDAASIVLQMPDAMKRRSRSVVRTWRKGGAGLAAAFMLGAVIAVIEGICTGQVYVPTLALIARQGEGGGSLYAWGLLALYNLMFILPLLVILALTRVFSRVETWLTFGRKEVLLGKIVLAGFFLALAAVMVVF